MEFENKIAPSVIDETLYKEAEKSISVKSELEICSVLSYFEERRDPDGKFKKKSKESYKTLLKVYWPFYLIPLSENETAIGIDAMQLDHHEIITELNIADDQIKNDLDNLDDDALFNGLENLKSIYKDPGKSSSIAGIINPELTKALIELANFSENKGFLGIPITPLLDETKAETLFNIINNYSKIIEDIKADLDNKNKIIGEIIQNKTNLISTKITNHENEYNKKIGDLKPFFDEFKREMNEKSKAELDQLKQEKEIEVNQTMNLIKEAFKPIANKITFLNDLWEKDKNSVLAITGNDKALISEINTSIDRFKARISEFDKELTNINQEINKISERFTQINQKYTNEEKVIEGKYNGLIKEEDNKRIVLENERDSKINDLKSVQDRLKSEQNSLLILTDKFKEALDQASNGLNEKIAKFVTLDKPILLQIPIWFTSLLLEKKNTTRNIVLPPVFLPRILPKKIQDDGLGQREIPIKIYHSLFLTEIKEKFGGFLSEMSDAKKQMDADIGEDDYFKLKEIRNNFIDGMEMFIGRQLILPKNKELIQTNVLSSFKFSE